MKKVIIIALIIIALGYTQSFFCMFTRAQQRWSALRRRGYTTPQVGIKAIRPSLQPSSLLQEKPAGVFNWLKKTQTNLSTFPKFSSGARVVELLNEGQFPSYFDIKNIASETGFFRSFFLKKTLNHVDDKGETLLGKAIGLIIQDIANLTDEKIEVITKLYELGARLSSEEQDAYSKNFPAVLRNIIDTYAISYSHIKISMLHRFARLLSLMSYIGTIGAKPDNIDMKKIALLAKIPLFSPAISSKSISQIKMLSDEEREALFHEDINNLKELGLDESLCSPDALLDMLFFIKSLDSQSTTGFLKGVLRLPATASAVDTKAAFIKRYQDRREQGTETQKAAINQFIKNLDEDIKRENLYKSEQLSRE